jgi:hypothetical protein
MKVFIGGPRTIRTLHSAVEERLNSIIEKNITVLVGDANGIDKEIQEHLYAANYKAVLVYASNGIARNNVGQWEVRNIPVTSNVTGFAFYAEKDKAMADNADYGFMIWNGKSKGTLNNIINLSRQSKVVLVYFTPHKKFYSINSLNSAMKLINYTDEETRRIFANLTKNQKNLSTSEAEQLTLFQASI